MKKAGVFMLSPKDFVARWIKDSERLVSLPKQAVDGLALAAEDKVFLAQAGLPADAAPFLSFEAPATGELPTVAEQWGLASAFQRYRVIGTDGSGNPIALDQQQQGEVVCLDHENQFARVRMNTSVRQLAESLLAYRKLVEDSRAEFGPDAFLDGKTSAAAREALRQRLTVIDPAAMQPGCFWQGQLQNLDANAG
jgi:hypothetical protein